MAATLDLFSAPARDWFEGAFAAPTEIQERGWAAVAGGRHTLMCAPTGSGKTLAAFLWTLDRLAGEPVPAEAERCRVLYISPLKALTVDIERNLRAPLAGMRLQAERAGLALPEISVAVRTGDTSQQERRQIGRRPPDILITTPESLFLMLTSAARSVLKPVRWVIVDEIHSIAATKRGAHLALSLERLVALADAEPQRIGLSATQRPLEEVARFLGGTGREVDIVDAGARKTMQVSVEVPVEDMAELEKGADQPGGSAAVIGAETALPRRSIWPAIHPRLLELIREHRSTIIFVNSRRLAERLAARLNELAGPQKNGRELVRAISATESSVNALDLDRLLAEGGTLYLVAPALHVHPTTDTLLRYISPEIEWEFVGIDERWREGVKVVFRKRPDHRSKRGPELLTRAAS